MSLLFSILLALSSIGQPTGDHFSPSQETFFNGDFEGPGGIVIVGTVDI